MPTPHESVNYVEPNLTSLAQDYVWNDDGYERAPRLEDYSIMLNLEVEVCSRKNISNNQTVTKDVLILSFTSKEGTSSSTVNFMGGTKIETNDKDKTSVNFLTTHYADMYVGDLIDYGTTEMIGVKSVDIEFQKSCVPIINIKFTDVRGMSLFQPTELSRTNSYQGIGGINADNVAQSFFQCFFRVPMPKFTITIKGFYGKPVTYEVLCDKFQTSFNSETGDFDIDTRFIGYSYSFLTDIVMDALVTAPYSDYGALDGNYNKYWVEQINSGRFTIPDKNGTMVQMPTLYEIWKTIKIDLKNIDGSIGNLLTDENMTHSEEIGKLNNLKDLYSLWYTTLYNLLCERYGEEYCYLFEDKGCYYRILLLTTPKTEKYPDLREYYEYFPDSFKEINRRLNSAIDEYNASGKSFKKLNNVSFDFSAYKRNPLFNYLFVNGDNEIVFNGFSKENNLPQTDVFNRIFKGVQFSGETAEEEAKKFKREKLSSIYNDGVDQYVYAFCINVDYRPIQERIMALEIDSKRTLEDKQNEMKLHAFNEKVFNTLKWYPSVENFTKIMMAHLETLMKQMYDCVSACHGRKASDLRINPAQNLDVNMSNATEDTEIPPFPRAHKPVVGNDGITRDEDAWIGEFVDGKGFAEVDFINGLFNGAEKVIALYNQALVTLDEMNREVNNYEGGNTPIVKHPLSSFDFFISRSPYGSAQEISSDISGYELAGRIAIRMFDILGPNYLNLEFNNKLFNSENAKFIGRIEADNFYNEIIITNDRLLDMIRNGVFDSTKILEYITTASASMPWGNTELFKKDKNGLWLSRYTVDLNKEGAYHYYNTIYPIQDISFAKLNEYHNVINTPKLTDGNGEISIRNIPRAISDKSTNEKDTSNCGFGTTYILENIDVVDNILSNANSDADSGYTEIYDKISSAMSFDNADGYNSFYLEPNTNFSGRHSVSLRVSTLKGKVTKAVIKKEDNGAYLVSNEDKEGCWLSNSESGDFKNASRSGNLNDFTISEIFSFSRDEKNLYSVNRDSSLKVDVEKNPNLFNWGAIGGYQLNQDEVKLTFMLMGITLNSTSIGNYVYQKRRTALYLPKLVVLQIGAIIYAAGGIQSSLFPQISRSDSDYKNKIGNAVTNLRNACRKKIPLDKDTFYVNFLAYIINLNITARQRYEKYYLDWIKSHTTYVSKLLSKSSTAYLKTVDEENKETNRRILNQDDAVVKELTNELLRSVCVIKLSVHHEQAIDTNKYHVNIDAAKNYLDGFVERLSERYQINNRVDENGNITKMTDEPHKTSNDMKKELYRYMKQLYDKWIPMSSFDDWKLESFFIGNDGEEKGHKFYFIDSYYNDVSKKLLINPVTVSDKIDALLSSQDINSMLLGFMADMYSANRAMLMVIQNFADLKKPNSMNEMFKPMPYNSISWDDVNKYPSFVVVYPYQPSKNLDVYNGEYANDGFMLNDEFETPVAIRSKSDKDGMYRIPAFGVSYGKQYQSYFKKVNINMQSPVATEQSIRAKHALLRASKDGGEIGSKGQDLYDIYATQSYTCDVEMMGCAWVQPLMYFVLLNVPMFRGSYMIMKVKHTMKPGDMTTTFTGCRMANVSNTLVEDIFTDGSIGLYEGMEYDYESDRYAFANTDNDCAYKVYALEEENGVKRGTFADEKDFVITLYRAWKKKITNNDLVVRLIVAQDALECKFGKKLCADYNYGGVKKTSKERKAHPELSQWASFNSVDEFVDYTYEHVYNTKTRKDCLTAKTYTEFFSIIQNLDGTRGGAYCVGGDCDGINYQYQIMGKDGKGGTYKTVESILNSINEDTEPKKPVTSDNTNNKKDIKTQFFNAINKSASNTASIGVELSREDKKDGYIKITQANKQTDKLHVVFDMILNSEYFNNVQELGWIYPNGGLVTACTPSSIYCKVVEKVEMNKDRGVFTCEKGVWDMGLKKTPEIPTKDGECNTYLLKALAKRREKVNDDKNFAKEVPQLHDVTALDKYKPQDCGSMVTSLASMSGDYVVSKDKKSVLLSLGFSNTPNEEECRSKMVKITVDTMSGKKEIMVHRLLAAEIKNIFEDIKNVGFSVNTIHAYCYRRVKNPSYPNSKKLSMHSFGCAIDINGGVNPFRKNTKPLTDPSKDTNTQIRTYNSPVVKIFAKYGWGWGGRYGDYMHFSKANGS